MDCCFSSEVAQRVELQPSLSSLLSPPLRTERQPSAETESGVLGDRAEGSCWELHSNGKCWLVFLGSSQMSLPFQGTHEVPRKDIQVIRRGFIEETGECLSPTLEWPNIQGFLSVQRSEKESLFSHLRGPVMQRERERSKVSASHPVAEETRVSPHPVGGFLSVETWGS